MVAGSPDGKWEGRPLDPLEGWCNFLEVLTSFLSKTPFELGGAVNWEIGVDIYTLLYIK